MKNKTPTIAILITAAIWAGFGLWLGFNPRALLTAFGIEGSTPQMLTEIRAFYGGIELAIAMVMVVLWRRGQLIASLLIGGLPLLGSASGRVFGMVIDGFSSLHAGFALLELIGAIFCLASCWLVAAEQAAETS